MKKNTILYVLLIFLIVVNGFFLFNYLKVGNNKMIEAKRNRNFIVKELNFNATQLEQFNVKSEKHHEAMKRLSHEIKALKDELFPNIFDKAINESVIDSLMSLICEKEKEQEKEIFYHFRAIQDIANDEQKEKFKMILMDALRKGNQGNRPPPPPDNDRRRPPPRHD